MKTIALTGRISSGKSTALAMFAGRGAAILDTDAVVHRLLEDEAVRSRVADELGTDLAGESREYKKVLADTVFTDNNRLQKLQRMLFPLVRVRVEEWIDQQAQEGAAVAVIEVPMLLEARMESMFDYVILIMAPEGLRRDRSSNDLPPGEFERRDAHQMSDEERQPFCHLTYDNSGSLDELEEFVASVIERACGDGG